jgi:tellurite resistance protein
MKAFLAHVDDLLLKLASHGYYPTPIIDLGVLVARADGRIDDAELLLLKELFGVALGERLPIRVVEHLVYASQDVIEEAGSTPRIRLLAEILLDCEAVESALIIGYALARVDGGHHEKEARVLEELATFAGVSVSTQAALRRLSDEIALPELRASTARLPSASSNP